MWEQMYPKAPMDFAEAVKPYTDEDGVVNLEQMVRDAADSSHPAHKFFEWDYETAAHMYRLRVAQDWLSQYRIDGS